MKSMGWLVMGLLATATGMAWADVAPPRIEVEARAKNPDLHGALLREGKPLDFSKAPWKVVGIRCREESEHGVSLQLVLPADATPYHVDDEVLDISGTPGLTRVGEKLTPQTKERAYDPVRDSWGRVLAWIGPTNRASEATLPTSGWVKFIKLNKSGPIIVEVDLDFGPLGHVQGTARVDKTEEITCVSPSPPSPPPPSK